MPASNPELMVLLEGELDRVRAVESCRNRVERVRAMGMAPSPQDLLALGEAVYRRQRASERLTHAREMSHAEQRGPAGVVMGHANVATTVGYDRRPEAAKRKAAGLVGVPYR